jgi:transcriptional regulator with XRE-family HTH domain
MPRKRTPKNNGRGRPLGSGRLQTAENADRICALLEEGWTLRQIAKELGFKTDSEIVRWGNNADGPHGFAQRYARAMVARYERMAHEVIEIADEIAPVDTLGHVDTGWVQQQRLRSDNRKWLLSKVLPKKYGDRVEATITGDPNAPLLTRIELVAVPSPNALEPPTIDHDDD